MKITKPLTRGGYTTVVAFILILFVSLLAYNLFNNKDSNNKSSNNLSAISGSGSGLVAHYEFEGNTNDSSGNNNNGTALGGPSYTTGKIGQAMSFDGIDDYVLLPISIVNYNDEFSVSLWFNTPTLHNGGLISEDEKSTAKKWGLKLQSDGTLNYSQYNGTSGTSRTTTVYNYPTNTWTHLAIRRTDAGIYMYVNGEEVALDSNVATDGGLSSPPYWIGRIRDDYFNGKIDDVRVYNRVLSLSEIQELYNIGSGPVNGQCGSSNGDTFSQTPTSNLCSSGNTSSVSLSGTIYSWTCSGTNGGTTASCSATYSEPIPDTQPPSTPTGLSATAISSNQINLSWNNSTDNIGVTGYKIYRNGSQIATSNTNSYSNTGLSPETTYTYTVSAYDGVGNNSLQSSSVSAMTQAIPPNSCGTPRRVGTPGPDNTGPCNEAILTPYTGSSYITEPNTIIENVTISAKLRIQADNVTIRNFRLNAGSPYGIQATFGAQGLVLEDGEIYSIDSAGIIGGGFTARRLNVHDAEGDAIKPTSDFIIEDSWIHQVGSASGAHGDGVQMTKGGKGIIRGNNFDVPYNDPVYANSQAIIIGEQNGDVDDVLIIGNRINGGGKSVNAQSTAENIRIISNIFGPDYEFTPYGSGTQSYHYDACNKLEVDGSFIPGQDSITDCSDPYTGETLPPPTINGDFNNDGVVNSIDYAILIQNWNTSSPTHDLNNDGIVNSIDYVILVQNWG